jgi:hypothetical protein
MGLKGYRLWATVQLDSTCRAPPREVHLDELDVLPEGGVHHGVALQVAFERQILKPVFHLIGFRLWV